jgi:hypothetical protein
MKDDKEVHELSFLFANSLYDIRMRSGEQTMPSRSHQHRNAHHLSLTGKSHCTARPSH